TREAGEIVLRVRDTGVGITADLLPRIFDLFTQGDRTLARSEGGLGVGLTLVRSLVELHGGSVQAFSEGPNKGSEFVVRLPALGVATIPAANGPGPDGACVTQRRVLVVDDNIDAAEGMAMLLRVTGHEVQTAHNGPSALVVARVFQPEIVLLDL